MMTNERFSDNPNGRQEELSCKELVELVTEYIEGVLPLESRLRFEEHIAECDGCRVYLEQMRQTIQLSGTLSEEKISESGKAKLLEAFRNWKAP